MFLFLNGWKALQQNSCVVNGKPENRWAQTEHSGLGRNYCAATKRQLHQSNKESLFSSQKKSEAQLLAGREGSGELGFTSWPLCLFSISPCLKPDSSIWHEIKVLNINCTSNHQNNLISDCELSEKQKKFIQNHMKVWPLSDCCSSLQIFKNIVHFCTIWCFAVSSPTWHSQNAVWLLFHIGYSYIKQTIQKMYCLVLQRIVIFTFCFKDVVDLRCSVR